ncbi:MAG TPA: substrate-binding domain-containing protein [Desulfomonilia bacterium]|nr:substrate-binding domain-containing protein [Desulfomonilia bacterium]
MWRIFTRAFLVTLEVCLIACILATPASAEEKTLMMATTTSTDNTGLLDYLAPFFKEDTGIELMWTAVGTGKALAIGRNCDVDVLLVHDPDSEKVFIEEGCGVDRTQIMYNDFIIIGPRKDPAGIKGKNAREAFQSIYARNAIFASRGDKSGTHMMELSLWGNAGVAEPDKEQWYVQTGQGMLPTITVAAERVGYTLTDRGTYIKYENNFKGNPPLVILVEGDTMLFNQYSVIAVSPKRCGKTKYGLATEFSRWMTSVKGQKHIGGFKLMGKQLFIPNAR